MDKIKTAEADMTGSYNSHNAFKWILVILVNAHIQLSFLSLSVSEIILMAKMINLPKFIFICLITLVLKAEVTLLNWLHFLHFSVNMDESCESPATPRQQPLLGMFSVYCQQSAVVFTVVLFYSSFH